MKLWMLLILSDNNYVSNKAKGRIRKRLFQENKVRQIFRKTNISYPLIRTRTCACQGIRNVCFSENLTCFVFLTHPFWDSPFCLITHNCVYLKITDINYYKTKSSSIPLKSFISIKKCAATVERFLWKPERCCFNFSDTTTASGLNNYASLRSCR